VIDVKAAVMSAKHHAIEMLGQSESSLEEIERETYRAREVWSITLSFPRDLNQVAPFARLAANPLKYKRFLIDVETGELVAMKLREPAVP
jgi:hypothetical protein